MVLLVSPVLAAIVLGGCTPPPKPPAPAPAPQPASEQQISDIHDNIVKILPGALVGNVVMVKDGMAAVGGISTAAVHKGDSIQFLDASSVGVANGTISITPDPSSSFLIVDFTPTANGRAPMKGDVAVYLPATH
jgi:hypothetical protein